MKYKVAFICIHNSCRSQMAEGLARHLGSDVLESYSAGTEEYKEDWGLTDPSGGTIEDFRNTRDLIESKVKDLINRIKNNEIYN